MAALTNIIKQARLEATEEAGVVRGREGEVEVTGRLLALVDETIDEEGRVRAQRRIEEDFEALRFGT